MPFQNQQARTHSHVGPTAGRAGDFEIINCTNCGFAHALPLPSEEDLDLAYAQTYYREQKPDYAARAQEDAPWANMFYEDRLRGIEAALGKANGASKSKPRLVDVGCGPGHFLKFVQDAGWTCEGVEPAEQAARYAQGLGLTIHNQTLTSEWMKDQAPFDAAHCMNVLEHVRDPADMLRTMTLGLRTGGAICVGVPNDFSAFQLAARKSGAPEWWLVPPHHLNYFTFEALEALLQRCGLTPVSRLTSFPMEAFLLMGRNYIGQDATGRALHQERKSFDSALNALDPAIRRNFYSALAERGFGREAIVIARKEF